jgi:GDP/UDP-N,N'-diacetylbacillosamine 2-epimerase (hydrolysing)
VVVRRVCVITGSRAEFGLLRHLMAAVRESQQLELLTVATGMHLSPEFGLTHREIEAEGFAINRKVEMLLSSDTPVGIAKATGLGMIGFADAYADLEPDLVVVLGDRFEILSAVTAALYARIPVAHIHGGEVTAGAFDEGIRHAISKMSHLHFVAAEEYRRRVIQLGEDPVRVHRVGGLGIDGIRRTELLSREQLEGDIEFALGRKNIVITFHPVTLENATATSQLNALFEALERLPEDHSFVITKPNADTDGRALIDLIDGFCAKWPQRTAGFTSLGQLRYWSLLKYADAVVGNSSSGLLEAPSFGIPTVNVGDRQAGRLSADSVIDCEPDCDAISAGLDRALSDEFRKACQQVENPYGAPDTIEKIVEVLESVELNDALIKKRFHDLPVAGGEETR